MTRFLTAKSAFPADLYPNLAAALFVGTPPLLLHDAVDNTNPYPVYLAETAYNHRPARTAIARLACTCSALRREVERLRAQDGHGCVARWWRGVLATELRFGPTCQDGAHPGQRLVVKERAELHRLWLTATLGDSLDSLRRWSGSGRLVKILVVWVHRQPGYLKLQVGLDEYQGPTVTFRITEREHPEDDSVGDVHSDAGAHSDAEDELQDADVSDAAHSDAEDAAHSDADDAEDERHDWDADAWDADAWDADAAAVRAADPDGWDADAWDADFSAIKAAVAARENARDPALDAAALAAARAAEPLIYATDWRDINHRVPAVVAAFVDVPEAQLASRVEQWLNVERDFFFPFFVGA